MPLHCCKRCGYETKYTSHLRKHLRQEFRCVPIDLDHHFDPKELLYALDNRQPITEDQKRDEYFYQNWLERRLGGSHMKLQSGITDITTDTCHAEIKEWKSWKTGVGQLLAYSSELRRQEVALYLFGAPVACDISVMVNTFQRAGITHVYQLEHVGKGEVKVQPIFITPGFGGLGVGWVMHHESQEA
jgi:hypothetical protein